MFNIFLTAAALGAACIAVGSVILAVAWRMMIWMPGRRFRGAWTLVEPEATVRAALRDDLNKLAGEIGERHLRGRYPQLVAAAEFLEGTLRTAGYQPRRQEFEVDSETVWNIEVERTGLARPEEIIIVGAHYDTIPGSPGANDNGSAVVANLALARGLADVELARTLRFVFFVNEESPYHMTPAMGALRYAQACAAAGEEVVGMLALETIGCYLDEPESQRYPLAVLGWLYPRRGNFLAAVGNVASRRWLHETVRGLRKADFPVEGMAAPRWLKDIFRSDHAAFWQCGYPAAMITDTANFRYPHYHTPEDTTDKINFDALARVVTALNECLKHTGGVPS